MPEQAHTIERAAYLRRRKRQKRWVLLAQLGLLIGFFALWEIAAQQGWIDDFIMSSPSRIWKTLKNLYASGELFRHLGASCLATLIGFTLGTLAGTVIAILLWSTLCPRPPWGRYLSCGWARARRPSSP